MSTVSDRAILARIWVLMFTVFVDMVGLLMVVPLLPFYAKDMHASPTTIGLLIASFSMAQLATSTIWGRLSDRYGRKPVILVALFASVVAYLVFAVADSIWMLLLCRVAQGAGGGTTGVVQAYVSDAIVPESRAKALGWLSSATNAGVMLGPAVGSLAVAFGDRQTPGLLAALLCLFNVWSALRFLPESSVRASDPSAAPVRKRGSLRVLAAEVFRHPRSPVAAMIWVYSAGMLAFMGFNGVLALYLGDRFGITDKTIGPFYIYLGALAIVMRTLVLGPAVRRFGEYGVIRLGLASLAAGLLLIPFGQEMWGFALAVLLIPVGTALLFPATSSLLSRFAVKEEVGQTLGLQQTFGGVARMIGPIAGGFAFQHLGISSPFWAGSALMVGTGLFARGLRLAELAPNPAFAPAPTAISAVAEVGSDSES